METTVNMNNEIFKKITHASKSNRTSRSRIIMQILREMMKHIPDPDHAGSMVRYQKSRSPEDWHTLHIQVRMDEYEYMLDVRKLFKMSVSLIIAYGAERYLDRLIKKKDTDNNRFNNYVVIREVVDSIICWKLYWGYPRNIAKHIPSFHQDPTP